MNARLLSDNVDEPPNMGRGGGGGGGGVPSFLDNTG